MRDTKIVSDSIRDVKARLEAAKKKGLLRRCAETLFTDHEKQTALIKRFEELADELEVLELHKTQVLVEATETQEKAKSMILESTTERDRVLAECAALRRSTELQAEQLLRETRECIEEKHKIASQEIKNLEERSSVMCAEIQEKKVISEELNKNSLVIEEWRRRKGLSIGDVILAVRASGASILPTTAKKQNDAFLKNHGLVFDAFSDELISLEELESRKFAHTANGNIMVKFPLTKTQETITLNPEQELQEHKAFYAKTNVDLPPDFEDTARDIWNRNKTEIEKEIQEKGFDGMLIVPGNLSASDLKDKRSMEKDYYAYQVKDDFSDVVSKGIDKPRIILYHKLDTLQQINQKTGLDVHLNITAEEALKLYEANPEKHLSTLEDALILERLYFEKTRKHISDYTKKSGQWLPGFKVGARVCCSYWNPGFGKLAVFASDSVFQYDFLGLRPARRFF